MLPFKSSHVVLFVSLILIVCFVHTEAGRLDDYASRLYHSGKYPAHLDTRNAMYEQLQPQSQHLLMSSQLRPQAGYENSAAGASNNADDEDSDADADDEDISRPSYLANNQRMLTSSSLGQSQAQPSELGSGGAEEPRGYDESQRSERETDDLEKFFDTHLGADAEQTGAESKLSTRILLPNHNSLTTKSRDIKEDRDLHVSASSPLIGIIHSLLSGRRPTITVEAQESDDSPSSSPGESESGTTAAASAADETTGDSSLLSGLSGTGSSSVEYAAIPVRTTASYNNAPSGDYEPQQMSSSSSSSSSQSSSGRLPPAGYYYAPISSSSSSESSDSDDSEQQQTSFGLRHQQVPRRQIHQQQQHVRYVQGGAAQYEQQPTLVRQNQQYMSPISEQHAGYSNGYARIPIAGSQHYRQALRPLPRQPLIAESQDSPDETASDEPVTYGLSFGSSSSDSSNNDDSSNSDDEPQVKAESNRYFVPRRMAAQLATQYQQVLPDVRYNKRSASGKIQRNKLLADIDEQIKSSPYYADSVVSSTNKRIPTFVSANSIPAVVGNVFGRKNHISLQLEPSNHQIIETSPLTSPSTTSTTNIGNNISSSVTIPVENKQNGTQTSECNTLVRRKRDSDLSDADSDGVWVDDDEADEDNDNSERQNMSPQSSNVVASASNDDDDDDDDDSADSTDASASSNRAGSSGQPTSESANHYNAQRPSVGPASYELSTDDFGLMG